MNAKVSSDESTDMDVKTMEDSADVKSSCTDEASLRSSPYIVDQRKITLTNDKISIEAEEKFAVADVINAVISNKVPELESASDTSENPEHAIAENDTDEANASNIVELPFRRRAGKSYVGNIDGIEDGKVYGWILAPTEDVIPVLLVDGRPILSYSYPLPRPDVNEHLGITGDTGFEFDVDGLKSDSKIELNVLINNKLVHMADYESPEHQIEENFFSQLDQALRISKQADSIAITCWDGGHNPVGRAKVLYDVAKSKRPAVIITYLFETFGERIWAPIRSTDIAILTIPWSRRGAYIKAINRAGLVFDTVWICKQRFPSFELANIVSHDNTSLVLDFDDNEEEFSKSINAKNKAYGQTSINYARMLTGNVVGRTAASISLKEKFEATMVRHARNTVVNSESVQRHKQADYDLKIGFIGTVRPHKNLLEASRAVKAFNWSSDFSIQLHVYGDVGPATLVTDLQDNDVVVKQNIPMSELSDNLADMDVILTGFPSNDINASSVTEYQISSKIGDALAVGRPVLVPEGPSVSDLEGIPGVFLFNPVNFAEKLHAAITHEGEISLPSEFTFDGAYKQFEEAEAIAKESPLAKDVFTFLTTPKDKANLQPTLVLLWKQNDSGFYGRRVDQIARSYKRNFASHRVIVLELMHSNTKNDYENLADSYVSEHRMLLDQVPAKKVGMIDSDGVEIHQIHFSKSEKMPACMDSFLLENALLPSNTVFVVFPIIQFYKNIEPSIRSFPKIVDVVDNQFSWGGKNNQKERVLQYYALARSCDAMVFNSEQNFQYFRDNDVSDLNATIKVIPNWYELPGNTELSDKRSNKNRTKNAIYSGNMNDRIDWELLARLVDTHDDLYIHLVGTANRGLENLVNILDSDRIIYHGPLSEENTLELLQHMDVAVMPHIVDDVSIYMNPLKVHMYQRLGLPTVSSDVPGIESSELLHIAENRHAFVSIFTGLINSQAPRVAIDADNASSMEYFKVISALRAKKSLPEVEDESTRTSAREYAKVS